MTTYYKGDDFDAFGQEWAEINLDVPEDWVIARAEFKVGNLPVMVFKHPEFPIRVSLDAQQTIDLKDYNTCTLAIFDENNRKQTCEGSWTFQAENKMV